MPRFHYQSRMPVGPASVFRYHSRPGAFERLIPPWERIQILARNGGIEDGAALSFRIRKGPFSIRWVATHDQVIQGKQFRDVQSTGPFKKWEHLHRFLPGDQGTCLLTDEIDFETPLGLGHGFSQSQLQKMFRFRHRRTHQDLTRHAHYGGLERRHILMVGRMSALMTGLAAFLGTGGHRVYRLTETGDRRGFTARPFFEGSGEPVLEKLDTVLYTGLAYPNQDREIMASNYLQTIASALPEPPGLLIRLVLNTPNLDRYTANPGLDFSTAGSRIDGSRTDNENSTLFAGPRLSFQREIALHFASLIQSPYSRMIELLLHLETFLFLEGSARTPQFLWVAEEDAIGAVFHALSDDALDGAYAVTAPEPSTRAELQDLLLQRSFTAYTLNRTLKVLPWASPGHSPNMEPELSSLPRLMDTGFKTLFSSLESAIGAAFGEGDPPN